ncbi:hypothetical protein FALBO_11863 [Fusarium albosuccineum]|uniref:Histidine kinase group protein n=1 Tax=Fusarium albosuccineum TaxID=1237068 RepID=A0A8H4L525_9HYPO|nr:hypothetical protein FALBO_11863 [Fusarium albosuccineum]
MPIEILETIANINYNTPRPRPIDPAVLFDMVKIRRLVDEATNLAVRAASDIASPILTNVNGGMPGALSMSALGMGASGHGAKLSRERKFRMREQASQKLARAYRLDEIACSVATMQGASPIEEVGNMVLQRSPQDLDAKYVHFFHEKIPSRQLAESTSLQPLTEIITEKPNEGEALRTRAIVKTFKNDYEGAAQDLTLALSVCRIHQQPHQQNDEDLQLQQGSHRSKRRHQDVILAEKDQPATLEGQLLFLRATAYLTLACQNVGDGMPPAQEENGHADADTSDGNPASEPNGQDSPEPDSSESLRRQAESRKLVKTYAKRSLRDFMSFISRFEYSPDLPTPIVKDFNDRVSLSGLGTRNPRSSESTYSLAPHTTYPISDLFAAVPLADLPPYPTQDIIKPGAASKPSALPKTCEWCTYHPLLTDALHSLLLCHCLVQTSTKELLRHTYMVARLVRLADGYPIFQVSRSPARSDWVDIMRRADNWIQLSASWDTLCAPAPLPFYFDKLSSEMKTHGPSPASAAAAASSMLRGTSAAGVAEEQRQQRLREQAIVGALHDERVCDEETFRASVEAREKRAEQEHAALYNGSSSSGGAPATRRWALDDGKEYPILTERAAAVAQWVLEAPVVTGATRRKKRTKKPSKTEGVGDSVEKLNLEDTADTAES